MMHEIEKYSYISLRQSPNIKETAAKWFSDKWSISAETYLKCIEDYLDGKTEYGWYVCILNDEIVAGLGVVENDFHNRKDLTPNICAVYTQEKHRCKGIAGNLLNLAVEDLKGKGISPVYILTDHIGFYERYGFEFLCMAQGNGEPNMSRMYIHK